MSLILYVLPFVAAAIVSYGLTPFAGRIAARVGALDMPGPRKVHLQPIPRLGGLAVVASIIAVSAIRWMIVPAESRMSGRLLVGIDFGLLPILAVSILDDIKTLRSGPKFLAHVVGAAIAVAFGISLNSEVHLFGQTIAIGILAWPLSVLWLVGVTNAFNIVDGLDGLSTGLALISAISLAGVFGLAGQSGMGVALVLAGALAGFLPYNMYPARMFLGDTGAAGVGFCLAALALKGGATLSAGFATLLPVFVLGLPIAETLISMARRLMRRLEQKGAGGVFEADRNHMHHRLLALGMDHPHAVYVLYGAGLLLASCGLVSMFMTARDAALLVVALLLAGFLGLQRLGYDEFAVIRNGTALRVYEAPVLNKSMFVVFIDLLIVGISACAAVALKTDDWRLASHGSAALALIVVLAPITVTVFWRMGLYRGTWRLAGAEDFARACCAGLVASLLGLSARMLLAPGESSIALFSIYALVSVLVVAGSRASYQILAASHWRAAKTGAPALIYGAGRQGVTALREMAADVAATFRPVAFIDDDPEKAGRIVSGMPVVGSGETIDRAIRRLAVRAVIVATDAIPELRLVALGQMCEQMGVAMLRMQISFECCTAAIEPRLELAPVGPVLRAAAPLAASIAKRAALSPRDLEIAARPEVQVPASTVMNLRFEEACLPGTSQPLAAELRCPMCKSARLRRSRVSNISERVRKRLSEKRLYRCESCDWRGWREAMDRAAIYQSLPAPTQRTVRWDSIDAVVSATPARTLAH